MTPMPDPSRPGGAPTGILLQFLAWVAARPRGYAEAIEAWRTSCPRLPAWEDAVDEGLVRVMSSPTGRRSDATIELTPRGAALLAAAEERK
jgi:hypothetical protein